MTDDVKEMGVVVVVKVVIAPIMVKFGVMVTRPGPLFESAVFD